MEQRVSDLKSDVTHSLVPNLEAEPGEPPSSRQRSSRRLGLPEGKEEAPEESAESNDKGGAEDDGTKLQFLQPSLNLRRQRMHTHFDDLVYSYFGSRLKDIVLPEDDASVPNMGPAGASASSSSSTALGLPALSNAGLDSFSTNLCKFTRYNSIRPLATLSYTADMFNNASIVSSIEFDKDNDFFAIAGVTKRIKIYDYNTVLKDMVDIHYPTIEMTCNSKISCVAWSFFYKNSLVSSDYEGTVSVWDTSTAQRVKTYMVSDIVAMFFSGKNVSFFFFVLGTRETVLVRRLQHGGHEAHRFRLRRRSS